MKIVALRIFVDTAKAYTDGVPRLLDLMEELGIRGSFFFGMGSESTGSTVSKLFGSDNQDITASAPGILRDTYRRGQDCGICGWNPREWERRFEKLKDTTLESNIKKAIELFARRAGVRPSGFASPGWRTSYMSLRIQDEMRFKYCSDTFGLYPYLPRITWKAFSTVQIPSTLPPMEDVLSELSRQDAELALSALRDQLSGGLNVLPINAILAAGSEYFACISTFLAQCKSDGVRFMGLDKVASNIDRNSLQECDVRDVQMGKTRKSVSTQDLT